MLKLSIIIPVYNLESYIERCIKSLIYQDVPKETYEIIVINDGSSDKTRDVVIDLIQKHSNIILIDKKNGGVSSARNAGLEKSKGKYIMFVDGDDYIVENSLSYLIEVVEKNNLQIGLFTRQNETDNKELIRTENEVKIIPGVDLYYNNRKNDNSCILLIQRDFIKKNNITYTLGIPFLEDGEFISRLMCLADRTAFFDFPYYVYVKRPGSATNSDLYYSKKAIDGFIKAAINIKQFQETHPLSNSQKLFLNQPLVKFVVTAASACRSIKSIKYLPYVRNEYKRNNLNYLQLEGCNKEHALFGKWYNYSIYYYFVRRFFVFAFIYLRKFKLFKSS